MTRHLPPHLLVAANLQSFFRSHPPSPLRRTSLEDILELARDLLHISHAAGSGSLSSLGLHAPIVYVVKLNFSYQGSKGVQNF